MPVKRTSKTVETSSQGEVWRAEGAADQVSGVCADVATFVVGVDGKVESHEFNKVLVLSETELVGQVVTVVLVLLDWSNLTILVDVAVNLSGDGRELSNEVHGVLKRRSPVILLRDTILVRLGKCRVVVQLRETVSVWLTRNRTKLETNGGDS